MDLPHVINIQTVFDGKRGKTSLAENFENPQSRGKNLQFYKLRLIHPNPNYPRVVKVTNDDLDC